MQAPNLNDYHLTIHFFQEDHLACELENLNRKYLRRAEINWVDFYTQKLDDVNLALATLQKQRELVGVCIVCFLECTYVCESPEI